MHKFILALAGVALLASCETETHASFALENNSASKIYISGTSAFSGESLQDTLKVGEAEIMDAFNKRGIDFDTLSPIDFLGTDHLITNANGDTLQKSFAPISHWKVDITGGSHLVYHLYTLTITDQDF